MSQNCNHNCSSCGENCSARTAPQSFLVQANPHSSIKKVIGVVSGKGGVGKSSVSAMLAVAMRKKGYRVGIIDADITGPSIPNMFNIHTHAGGCEDGILPEVSKSGIEIMSMNLLLENENDAVIFRGPVLAGIVKQFYTDVIWEDIDYLFVDMPPGTGDVPLTVFQSYPLDGIVIVSTPQSLVSMIVSKACDMAKQMDIPVLGLIENMSYVECPDCGKKLDIFPTSHVDEVADQYGLPILARLPMLASIMQAADVGRIEDLNMPYLKGAVEELEKLIYREEKREIIAIPVIDSSINDHFGRSEQFMVVSLVDDVVIDKRIETMRELHSAIPTVLASLGVSVVLCKGMGVGAYNALRSRDIKVIRGVEGDIDRVIEQYVLGNLVDTENVCEHDHDCKCEHE
ncbi:MAG: dinitrogenase iron-molybdenum cofactor biosynthesis protein [Erysipelotrichaceae bacterium]|nr:dinitrogenase iron-molybdenum cofactor biosynthesis protein [Erysipelotrichaceae bacterium]